MLKRKTADNLARWVFKDVLCRWGAMREIVTDNGAAFVKMNELLGRKYGINTIRISGYNSRSNRIAEQPHFDV